jgi:hypothetical protein
MQIDSPLRLLFFFHNFFSSIYLDPETLSGCFFGQGSCVMKWATLFCSVLFCSGFWTVIHIWALLLRRLPGLCECE